MKANGKGAPRTLLETLLLGCAIFLILNAVPEFIVWRLNRFMVPCWVLGLSNVAWAIVLIGLIYWKGS